jgi:heat shock protein HslJ
MNGTNRISGRQTGHRWAGALGAAVMFGLVVTGCAKSEPANPGAGGAATAAATVTTSADGASAEPAASTPDSSVPTSASGTRTSPSEPSASTITGDSTTMSGSVPSIEDITWTLVAALDNKGATVTIPDGTTPTLEITDDRLAVRTGCNSGSGAVAVSPAALEVGAIATTRMACDDARMSLEQTILGVLSTRSSYRIDGSNLTISNSAGTLVYQPGAAESTAPESGLSTARPGPTRVTAISPEPSLTWPPTRSMLPSIPEDPRGSTN